MKIALAQTNQTVTDIENNKNKIISFANNAYKKGAEVVIFANNSLSGGDIKSLCLIKDFYETLNIAIDEIKKNVSIPVILTTNKNKKNIPILIQNNNTEEIENKIITIKNNKFYCIVIDNVENFVKLYDDKNISATNNIVILSCGFYYKNKTEYVKNFIKNFAKEKSVNVFYVNLTGSQDGYIYDGGSFCILKNGNITNIAKLFEEDLLLVDTNVNNDIELKTDLQKEMYDALVLGLKDYCAKNGFKKVALGISGGIDSALVAAIATDALGNENVLGVLMPSQYTSKESVLYAQDLCNRLKIKYEIVPIKNIYDIYIKECSPVFNNTKKDLTEENLQARIRANILMAFSNKFGYFILCTCNKSEDAVGYSTLYGDMAGGYSVIGDLLKKDVYLLSNYRNSISNVIPEEIIKRAPTAELRENQKDSDSLPEYDILDDILEKILEKQMSYDEILNSGVEEETLIKVYKLLFSTEYKRRMSPISTKVTTTSFMKDIIFPMTNKYKICRKKN